MTNDDKIYLDEVGAKALLPIRDNNSNKGSFGKALLITGSDKYEGAGRLSLEAALRGGCGIVSFISTIEQRNRLIRDFPEAIYLPLLDNIKVNTEKIKELSKEQSALLVGCGSSVSAELFDLICALLSSEGAPIVLDADAINSISRFGSAKIIKDSRRKVILTPHVLEFSRITGHPTQQINNNRAREAVTFAKENNCILLLKGQATVITDGRLTYINTTGSSALSKGGSGDVLAGLLVSLLAFMKSPLEAAALSAFVHGRAGDALSEVYSSFGVTPSDLPKEAARQLLRLQKNDTDAKA